MSDKYIQIIKPDIESGSIKTNLDKKHTKYIVDLLDEKFAKREITPELLECIASFGAVLLQDLECNLSEDNDVLDDITQTDDTINRLLAELED